MAKLGATIAVLGALVVGLAGCDFEEEFYPSLPTGTGLRANARHQLERGAAEGEETAAALEFLFNDFEDFVEGEFTPIGAHEAEVKDKIVTGPFNGLLGRGFGPFGRSAGGALSAKTHPVKGTYIADLNGTTDSTNGTAEMTAIGALKFAKRSQGIACFEMKAKFTKNGTAGKGTFRSTGGTKGSATSRFSGSFADTVTTPKPGGTERKDQGKLKGRATIDRPAKAPPAACKALLKKLP